MRTLFLASSHRSQLESLKICAAMLYSSIKGSLKGRRVFLNCKISTLVKWNWRGSSVERDTLRPLENVFRSVFAPRRQIVNFDNCQLRQFLTWQDNRGKGSGCSWERASCWREDSWQCRSYKKHNIPLGFPRIMHSPGRCSRGTVELALSCWSKVYSLIQSNWRTRLLWLLWNTHEQALMGSRYPIRPRITHLVPKVENDQGAGN